MSRINVFVKLIAVLMIFGLIFQSCLKDTDGERRAEELKILEQYITNNGITVAPTASGLYFIEEVVGTGPTPLSTDWVEFSFSGRLVTNPEAVLLTSDSLTAVENSLYNNLTLYGPKRVVMNQIFVNGLREGISKMKAGGKARLIFPSTLGYGSSSYANIPAYSSLIMDIELINVIPDIIQFERTKMNNFLVANNITEDSTSTGLYYHETLEGTGNNPLNGNQVTFTYKGTFLNGKVFDDNVDGYTFTIGYNQVISGIEEGIKLMKKGGKARLVIPYYLAYGEQGYIIEYQSDLYLLVYPYTTLVFDVQITDIAK